VKSFSKIRFALFAALCVLIGCASSTSVRPETGKEPVVPKKIAVVPFEKLTSDDGSRVARCPVGGTFYTTCALPQNAEAVVQDLFLQRLEKSGKVAVIPPYQSDAVYRKVRIDYEKASVTEQLQRTGKALEVDAIVIGFVSCFRERVGYAYSAERPASVTFGIYMIQSSDGELIWGESSTRHSNRFPRTSCSHRRFSAGGSSGSRRRNWRKTVSMNC